MFTSSFTINLSSLLSWH